MGPAWEIGSGKEPSSMVLPLQKMLLEVNAVLVMLCLDGCAQLDIVKIS